MDANFEDTPISDNLDAIQNEVRRKTDLAWDHCSIVGKKGLQCKYCLKVINGGGITRMKAHLAKRKGDTTSCKKVPFHVSYQMESDMKSFEVLKRQKKGLQSEACSSQSENLQDISKSATSISENYFPPTTSGSQKTIKSVLATKKDIEAVDLSVARWMYDCCMPFNVVNSPYFQTMVDAIASVGRGYKVPTYYAIRGPLLKKNVEDMNNHVDTFRKYWEMTGCTLMADGWTDSRQRTLINFLVYCPQGHVFLKSVDASEVSKTAEMLFGLFKEIIDFVGPKNIVHLVTDNASNYLAVGKLVKKHYGHIFWSPCAAHCIDLMLEKFDSLSTIHFTIDDARKITKFIYNHGFALLMMRKFCKGDLLRPGATRFATNFLTLQSLLNHKDDLISMVSSREWLEHKISKTSIALQIKDLILNQEFWKGCIVATKVGEPLVKVLRIVDGDDRPSMGYIYEGMRKAKEEIKTSFDGKEEDYMPYIEIVDDKWETQLGHALHSAGVFLNPSIYYKDMQFATNYRIWSEFLDAVEVMYFKDDEKIMKVTAETDSYRKALVDFGRSQAILSRDKLLPAIWWQNYGGSTPNLQEMAIRVLSQTCSASGCERHCSVFERLHLKKRNRLSHKRLNDLVFVQCNLRLRDKQKRNKMKNLEPISLDFGEPFDPWVEEPILTNEDLENWSDVEEDVL